MSLFAGVPSSQARCRSPACPRSLAQAFAAASNTPWTISRGELTVAAGPHARMAEQPPVMSREELAQFGDMAPRDPGLLAIVHAAARPAFAWARTGPAQRAAARPGVR